MAVFFINLDHSEVGTEDGMVFLDLAIALWSKIGKKRRENSPPIIHFPTSEEVREVSERSKQGETSE